MARLGRKSLLFVSLFVTCTTLLPSKTFSSSGEAVTKNGFVRSKKDVQSARNFIRSSIFGEKGELWKVSLKEEKNYCLKRNTNPYCKEWYQEYKVRFYRVEMEFGLSSLVVSITPELSRNTLFWNRGHFPNKNDSSPNFYNNISEILKGRTEVFLFSMPFMFPNQRSVLVNIPRFSKPISFGPSHNELAFLDGVLEGSALKYFVQPQIMALRKLVPENREVVLAGLSGGGWTTTVLSAIETRFKDSVSVAGSLPIDIRTEVESDLGDWEQWLPGIYPKYVYRDLYILGTYPNRRVVNIYNTFDPCCFPGTKENLTWVDEVRARAKNLGGFFEVLVEESNQHDLGPVGLRKLLRILSN